jgi:hypothetical protein
VSTYTLNATQTLVTEECYRCHIVFAMPQDFQRRALDDHSISFWCPAGHCQHYTGKTTTQREKDRAEWFARQLANREEDIRSEKASHAVTKGKLTKARNRADKGVCQHCNRSFVNVARHVASQHPVSS